ncbi:DnaB-like helicase C-terminal domain-containing protein [Borreliella tanukii]|uniref:DnaB-like helicase C-terminal domain-containing protein n=1 Tax=Borreliella tanukii TaxID=56146 RepID=UPI003AB95EDC
MFVYSLALNVANNLWQQNRSVGFFFTLEMVRKSIVKRLISINYGIDFGMLNRDFLSKNEIIVYNQTIYKFNNIPFYIEKY